MRKRTARVDLDLCQGCAPGIHQAISELAGSRMPKQEEHSEPEEVWFQTG
jgi:hypothetical protein